MPRGSFNLHPLTMPFIAVTMVAGCVDSVESAGEVEGRVTPFIASNFIASNAITTNAITSNAIAGGAIAGNPLAGAFPTGGSLGVVTGTEVRTGLEDPDAQMLMDGLVGCALRPDQSLQWTSRFSATTRTWRGNVGLCPQWLASAPSARCLERVSACLLARNNAFGVSVPLSMRGSRDGSSPLALAPEVPLWPKVWRTNTTVASTQPCQNGESGVDRNCGWESGAVGRCTAGAPVKVGGGGCGLGSSTGDTMLRVCTRMHFCDQGGPDVVAQNDDACGSPRPFVSFTCPPDGYYAVMVANHQATPAPVGVSLAADPPRLPSSEGEVFRWREGAFFGTIFEPGALNPLKPQVRVNPQTGQVEEQLLPGSTVWVPGKTLSSAFAGVVYQKMWACSSSNWSFPAGYYERRVCAGLAGINCAAKYAGPCGLLCGSGDAGPVAGDQDYGDCADLTLHRWSAPLTPFLNHPCELLARDPPGSMTNDVLCRTVAAVPSALDALLAPLR
jgi:hypothetical protein